MDQQKNAEATLMWREAFNKARSRPKAIEVKLQPYSSKACMRIVLQDRKSLLYFKSADDWTANVAEAYDFRQLMVAMDFVRTARISNLDVLLSFANPEYDVRLCASC